MKCWRLLVLLLWCSTLVGCGSSSKKLKVGIVTNNTATFWNIAEAGARKAEKDFDVEVLFKRPEKATAADQRREIDDLLTLGVTGVAVSVFDPDDQFNYLNTISDKVHLLTMDNDALKSKRLAYIGTSNYAAGKAAGELVKKALPNGGTVAIFVGQIEPVNARERRQGVLDALAGKENASGKTYGNYTLHGLGDKLDPYTDGIDNDKAKRNAEDVLVQLQAEKNVCLVGLWAYNPPAIYAAVRAKDLLGKVQIVGFDEDDSTLNGIKEGHIYGTIVQQPYEFGYQSVKLLAELARGKKDGVPANGLKYVDHQVIVRDNVEAFQTKLKSILGK